MPAQVFGELRPDTATHGEKKVLSRLQANLPKEYSVYVECPLHDDRMERYPDFIVLTNYGVIVLEVKDWVHIEYADKHTAEVRTRKNQFRKERNPVITAREYAIQLSQMLQNELKSELPRLKSRFPWVFLRAVMALLPKAFPSTL